MDCAMCKILRHPLCITVSCFPQEEGGTEVPRPWLPLGEWSTVAKKVLCALENLVMILHQARPEDRQRLKLHVTGFASQVNYMHSSLWQTWLQTLAPFIFEIRDGKGMNPTVLPLALVPQLQTLAVQVSTNNEDHNAIQRALYSSSSLKHFHIYADSQEAASHVMQLLQVLELPDLMSLRVDTGRSAAFLPSSCLQDVTCLELGANVSYIGTVPNVRRLRLQKLHSSHHKMLAKQLSISLALDAFTPHSLMSLPHNLQDLTLSQKLNANAASVGALTKALGRLIHLCRLFVADFLTNSLVHLLRRIVFPRLHTFGFWLPARIDDCSGESKPGNIVFSPSRNVASLASAMPCLEEFNISCRYIKGRRIGLMLHWICRSVFPGLKGVTCFCPYNTIQLDGLQHNLQVVHKG